MDLDVLIARVPVPLDTGARILVRVPDVVLATVLEREGFRTRFLNTTYCGKHRKLTVFPKFKDYKRFDVIMEEFLEAKGPQWKKLKTNLYQYNPKVLLLHPSTFESFSATIKTAKIAKKLLPEVKIGVISCDPNTYLSATPLQEFFLSGEDIDFIVKGDIYNDLNHEKVVEVVERLISKGNLEGITGLVIKQNEEIIDTGSTSDIQDFESLPLPDMNLLIEENKHPPPSFSCIKLSKGCKYNCKFCSNREKPFIKRSPEDALEQIEYLQENYGTSEFHFYCSSMLHDKKWTRRLCNLLKQSSVDIMFDCYANIHQIEKDMLQKLKSVGCTSIKVGLESGSEKILETMDKAHKGKLGKEKTIEKCNIVKDLGISLSAGFVVGYPEETKRDITETLHLLRKIDPDHYYLHLLTPLPGTNQYKKYKKEELLKDVTFDKYTVKEINVETKIDEKILMDIWGKYTKLSDFLLRKDKIKQRLEPRNLRLKIKSYLNYISRRYIGT